MYLRHSIVDMMIMLMMMMMTNITDDIYSEVAGAVIGNTPTWN